MGEHDELQKEMEECGRVMGEAIGQIQAEVEPLDTEVDRLMELMDLERNLGNADELYLRLHRGARGGDV